MARKRPVRWNPVRVEIKAINEQASKVDEVFGVPRNRKVRSTTRIYDAQVNLGKKAQDRKDRQSLGDRTETRGWIVLRTADITDELPQPQKGWKITKLFVGHPSEQKVDYLIEEVRFESPLRGGPLLIYCEFERDREKAREAAT